MTHLAPQCTVPLPQPIDIVNGVGSVVGPEGLHQFSEINGLVQSESSSRGRKRQGFAGAVTHRFACFA